MVVALIAALILFAVFASVFVIIAMVAVDRATSLPSGPSSASVILPIAIVAVIALVIAAAFVVIVRLLRGRWERLLRQSGFAAANELAFSPRDVNPTYTGAIFQLGDARVALDHFFSTSGRYLDFGNYRYSIGSGKNRTTRTWGFLALQLDRRLPHMLLDARSNNTMFGGTNLPVRFTKDQILSLEGDFDRFFTLYCPREYERDALYIFTPDLMALLVDNASAFDVEIVDEWMFIYSAAPFAMHDVATIDRLLRIVDTIGVKTLARSDRYSDERAYRDGTNAAFGGAETIAPEGRRLKKRIPVAVFAFVGVFVVFAVARAYFGF